MGKQALTTRRMTMCALFAALTGVCSQIQIPLPFIPINLALLSVHLAGALLGKVFGPLSMAVYIALGVCGVPVFAGLGAGPGILFGKTGGYILGYLLCAMTVGLTARKRQGYLWTCLSMALGTIVCYAFGTAWFMALTGMSLWISLTYCVFPFLPGDALKVLFAAYLARRLRGPLRAMG